MTTATATQTEPVTEQPKVHQVDLIDDPSSLFDKMQEWTAKGWHVLSPATRISHLAPGWGVSVSLVVLDARIDDNGNGTDCYFDKGTMKPYERGLSRIGIDRITRCAGVSWDPVHCGRVDSRLIMHYAEFRAIGVVMNFDGTAETLSGHGCCDARDSSGDIGGWTPELWKQEVESAQREKRRIEGINGWTDRRVLGVRAKILQRAETNAKERCIRSLGLRHKYTVDELKNPFVVLKASYLPNMEDPAIRQMVAERAMNGTRALFAQSAQRPMDIIDVTPVRPAALPEAQPVERIEKPVQREAVPLQRVVTPPVKEAPPMTGVPPIKDTHDDIAEAMPTLPKETPQKADTPLNGVYVTDVKFLKSGKGKKGDWEMFKVTFSDGKSFTAFAGADGLVADAQKAMEQRTLVEYRTKQDGQYLNLVDILPAGSQPSIPEIGAAGFTPASDLKL